MGKSQENFIKNGHHYGDGYFFLQFNNFLQPIKKFAVYSNEPVNIKLKKIRYRKTLKIIKYNK